MSVKYYKEGEGWVRFPGTAGIPGKDAYLIAKENGYTGTREEYAQACAEFPELSKSIEEIKEDIQILQSKDIVVNKPTMVPNGAFVTDINKGEGNSISITYQIPSSTLSEFDLNVPQTRAVANELKKYVKVDAISKVANSGNYNDLINTPDLSVYVLKNTLSDFAHYASMQFDKFAESGSYSIELGYIYYNENNDVEITGINWNNNVATSTIIHSTKPITFTSGQVNFYKALGMNELSGDRYVYCIQWMPCAQDDHMTFYVNCMIYN